jgi:hypothetical protein
VLLGRALHLDDNTKTISASATRRLKVGGIESLPPPLLSGSSSPCGGPRLSVWSVQVRRPALPWLACCCVSGIHFGRATLATFPAGRHSIIDVVGHRKCSPARETASIMFVCVWQRDLRLANCNFSRQTFSAINQTSQSCAAARGPPPPPPTRQTLESISVLTITTLAFDDYPQRHLRPQHLAADFAPTQWGVATRATPPRNPGPVSAGIPGGAARPHRSGLGEHLDGSTAWNRGAINGPHHARVCVFGGGASPKASAQVKRHREAVP